jgi:hypothetical protein
MRNKFEAPELTLIGEAGEVVMGMGTLGGDSPLETAPDFEFEHDSL